MRPLGSSKHLPGLDLRVYGDGMAGLRALARPTGLRTGDHLCWAYDEGRPFGDVAAAFLHEGVARGERVVYTAGGTTAELTDQLRSLPERDTLLQRGQLVVQPMSDVYTDGGRLDPGAQTRVFVDAAEVALADGFSGLRVAGDLTALARDPAHWVDVRAYEMAVDAVIAAHPLTGMCGYAVSALPDARLRPLVALHGIRNGCAEDPGFGVRVRGDTVALAGEVDVAAADDLGQLLEGFSLPDGGAVTLDLAALDFLDVGGSRTLVRFADTMRAAGRQVRFVGAGRAARRVLELFDVELA